MDAVLIEPDGPDGHVADVAQAMGDFGVKGGGIHLTGGDEHHTSLRTARAPAVCSKRASPVTR